MSWDNCANWSDCSRRHREDLFMALTRLDWFRKRLHCSLKREMNSYHPRARSFSPSRGVIRSVTPTEY